MILLNKSDEEILNALTPLAIDMENGWNENNYQKFSLNMTDDFRNQVDLEEFNKQRNEAYPKLGNHELSNLVVLHKNPDNIIIIWKMKYEKRNELGLAMYYFKELNDKIVIIGSMFHA